MKNQKHEWVLLEGVIEENLGNRFFSNYTKGEDPTKSAKGETWYKIIGYADSVTEAQQKLYGRTYKLSTDCTHNEMVANDDPKHVWKCAKCGYIYGKDN